MNVLYLSDIHFGRELIAWGKFENRTEIQNQLIQTVATLPPNMKPDYIVVTGDIAWTGATEEYDMAYDWFSRLLDATGLDGKRISFCVGNHDVNRKIAVQNPISSLKTDEKLDLNKIDELYKYENINSFGVQIHAYNDFCHKLGVIPYQYYCEVDSPESDKFGFSKQWYSYAVGSKDIGYGDEKYRIVAFNSAMLSGYEDLPDDENFLGLPQIEQMISQKIIGKENDYYKIALFHHSERFLNTNEMNSYSDRPATLHKLIENVDLALCGHTETGAVPVIRRQDSDGILLNGGAAYYSDEHPNSFSILNVEANTEQIDICTFIYTKGQWCSQRKLDEITWKKKSCTLQPKGQLIDEVWKFTMFAAEQKKEITFQHVDFGFYANKTEIHYYYVNKKDVTRLLDFSGDENGVHIEIAPGRERSIEAMLAYCSIFYFIDQEIKSGKKEVKYELTDPKGRVVAQGVMPYREFSDESYAFYNLLQRLKKLEDAFGVRFSASDNASIQEQSAVTFLENYLEDGSGVISNELNHKFVYFSEKKYIFQQVYEKITKKQAEAICFEYTVPMLCNLFGAKIKLGNCKIVVVNLIPSDLNEVKKQLDTFMPGDRRRLKMNFIKNHQQIAVWRIDCEESNQDIKNTINEIKKKTICFEIEPQGLKFGNGILVPDEQEVKKKKLILKDTLSIMIESYRQLWSRT